MKLTKTEMPNNQDKGLRYNQGKARHDLVPSFAQEQYALVLTKGSEKYEERNWERGMKWIDILSRLKTGRFLCTNVRCCPSSLILTPQFGDAPPKYIISC